MPQRMLAISRHKRDATMSVTELVVTVLEGKDLSRADEREGCRYEEQD